MGKHLWMVILVAALILLVSAGARALADGSRARLGKSLEQADVVYYPGDGPAGGLAHVGYWTVDPTTLSERESMKATRIQGNPLHSRLFQPTQIVAGHEAHGILDVEGRRQWVTLRLPERWNGRLVVCGTPGLRNEYANEGVYMPWLLDQGYAVVSGDKGLENSWVSMLSGTHPTRYWGVMMHDMARWARMRLFSVTFRWPGRIYAVGLSNGGYQVRRALEMDSMQPLRRRIFCAGLDWSGTYFPDARVMDTNGDGKVDVDEYYAADTLVGQMDVAALTMGWAYNGDSLTTPKQYHEDPRYPEARDDMRAVGFSDDSDIFWGYYNTNYDVYKDLGLPRWQGVGYYNLTAYVYRAELLGHDQSQSEGYSCFYDPAQPGVPPPLYDWLAGADRGGWTDDSIQWALANANTGAFKAPMITVVGSSDGLLPLYSHSVAYRQAVETHGHPCYYRQYIIEHGPHVDAHADGAVDFDFDGIPGNEGAAEELTPLQAYVQRAFTYLIDWVEKGRRPPESGSVPTDPGNDISDPDLLAW